MYTIKKIGIIALISLLPAAGLAETLPNRFTVDQAVTWALEKNQTLLASGDTLLSAEQKVKSSRADLFAKGTLEMGYLSLYHQPLMKTAQGESGSAPKETHSWGLSLRQPLFRGYALKSRVDLARVNVRNKTLAQEMTRLDLIRNIKAGCYNLLLAHKLQEVAQSEVDSLAAHTKNAGHMYDQQLIPKNDLLRSQVALADSRQALERARADVASARIFLNRLMDRDVDAPLSIRDIDKLPPLTGDTHSLVESALAHRPVIHSLKNDIQEAEVSITLARSSYYPEVDLVGRYEQNSGELTSLENDYTNPENTSLSLELGWTFFDWGKTSAEVNAAQHKKSACVRLLKAMENQVQQEVKDALLDLNVAHKNIKTAETTMDQAIENFRITNAQYAQKVVTSTIVLDAQADLTRAHTNYYRALYGYMVSMAILNRSMGME